MRKLKSLSWSLSTSWSPNPNLPKNKEMKLKEAKGSFFGNLFKLFSYADKLDIFLMTLGMFAAIANGASLPLLALIFGQMTDSIKNTVTMQDDNDSSFDREEYFDQMKMYSLRFVWVSLWVFCANLIQAVFWETTCERQVLRLRNSFFSQVLRQDCAWYDLNINQKGTLANKLTDDIERVREGVGCKLSMIFQYLSTFVAGLAVGFYRAPKVTGFLMIIAPIIIFISGYIAMQLFGAAKREQIRYGVAGGIAQEALSSIRLVASLGAEKRQIDKYEEAIMEGYRISVKKYRSIALVNGIQVMLNYVIFCVAFWLGAHYIQKGEITTGAVFTIFFSVMSGAMTIGQAMPFLNFVSTAAGSAATLHDVIRRKPEIDSYSEQGLKPEACRGEISLRDVCLSYPSRPSVQVLNKVCLTIREGETVALVGTSGSGKSSIVSLLLRFYDPSSGQVLVDGVRVSDYNLSWLRNQMGVVNQEPVLFGVSIADNIRLGKSDITMEQVVEAAKMANAHTFIKAQPKGYDTNVGELGVQISGGQKQRIALARALVRQPRILLLDEATSALDSESEAVVQQALNNAMKGRTTVIVAHRLSTVRNADTIVAMKDGRIVEMGTHEELVSLKGHYYNLLLAQEKEESKQLPAASHQLKAEKTVVGIRKRALSCSSQGHNCLVNDCEDNLWDYEEEEVPVNEPSNKKKKSKKVNLLHVLSLENRQWTTVLLIALCCISMGLILPFFSATYADVLKIYTLHNIKDMDKEVYEWLGIYAGMAVAVGLSCYLGVLVSSLMTEKLIAALRVKAFSKLMNQDVSWFDDPDRLPSKYITILSRDPPLLKMLAGFRAGQLLIGLTVLVTALGISYYSNWRLAGCMTVVVPITVMALYGQVMLQKKHQMRDAKLMDKAGKITSEGIINLKTVQALGKERLFLDRYMKQLVVPYSEAKRQAWVLGISMGLSQSLIFSMYAIAFYFGGYFVVHHEAHPLQVYRVFFAMMYCATFLGQSSFFYQDYFRSQHALVSVFELLKAELPANLDDGEKPEIKGGVELEEVVFRYPRRPNVTVLDGVSLKVEPGQTVALVGQSGCGKSTIVGLLERFYKPNEGLIKVDGVDISVMSLRWLRGHIGLVNQEPALFSCTIRDNIACGALNPDKVPMADVISVAKMANIHDFIVGLPQGYETLVGEKGTALSGGQKQRIAIARALIRDPKILLLDEATSALDTESEKIVQEALDKARQGRTCIVIAHRLSTIQNADLIAVMEGGRVVEVGTHWQLKQADSVYARLTKNSTRAL